MQKTIVMNDMEYEVLDGGGDKYRLRRYDEASKMYAVISYPKQVDKQAKQDLLRYMVDMFIDINVTQPLRKKFGAGTA